MNHIGAKISIFAAILSFCIATVSCTSEPVTYRGPDYILFSEKSYDIGVISNDEWFEIPITATRSCDYDRNIGVEVISERSNAIERRHYVIESNTLTIPSGELTTSLRIRGMADNISVADSLGIALRLVIEPENVWDTYGIESQVHLRKCCPVELDNFTGYAKLTSTWTMQYMNSDARLVRTERDATEGDVIVVKDMFYDGYDVHLRFRTDDRLNPTIELDEHVIGTTGEAFGTIYGNGKLMMATPTGYSSYYSSCENYLLLYVTMYVADVGTVGTYVNIFEWITDDEAERILREGF